MVVLLVVLVRLSTKVVLSTGVLSVLFVVLSTEIVVFVSVVLSVSLFVALLVVLSVKLEEILVRFDV